MAYAAVQLARAPDGGWTPVGVWLAVPALVQFRVIEGDPDLRTFAEAVMDAGLLPEDRTWDAWLEAGVLRWSNGHDRSFERIEPDVTIERLFEREVLGRDPVPYLSPELRPSHETPEGLGGWKDIPKEAS